MSNKEVRVRIAPSPTGILHLGTVRTGYYNYLMAKKHNGKFILRIEDTDQERNKKEFTQGIIDGFKWLGIEFDEGPYYQSDRFDLYKNTVQKLLDEGKAYECYATPEELDEMRKAQRAAGKPERYDNRHRNLTTEEKEKFIAEGRKPVIRFRLPDNSEIKFKDEIRGDMVINTNDLGGDPVIARRGGIPLYNFVCAIDDGEMGITHVIRGEDHLHNTAKQIPIMNALGYETPIYAHAPLIFTKQKEKLSKRKHGDIASIEKYQKEGYLPEALGNYLVHMSWTKPDKPEEEIFNIKDIAEKFDLSRVSKSAAVYDLTKLNWFNNSYLKELTVEKTFDLAKPFLETSLDLSKYSKEDILKMLDSVRQGANKLDELPELIKFFFDDEMDLNTDENKKVLNTDEAKNVLKELEAAIDSMDFNDPTSCKKTVDDLGEKLSLKGKKLYWPIRVAISGSCRGPDLGLVIALLGKERIESRVKRALSVTV